MQGAIDKIMRGHLTIRERDRVLIRLCDSLHRGSDVDDELWAQLSPRYRDEAILELLMLAGTYRTVRYLVNSLRLPLEPRRAAL